MPARSSALRRLGQTVSPALLAACIAVSSAQAQAPAPAKPPAPTSPAAASPAPAASATDDPVVARIGDAVLHRSDVLAAQKQLPAQVQAMPMQQIYPLLLDQLVNIVLLSEAGRKQGLQNDPEVKRRIDTLTSRAIEEAYVAKLVEPAVNDAKLRARYDEEVKKNPAKEEVQASHILVANEAAAKDIIAQLDKGADFAKLAQEKSTDPGAKNGGDLGWFTREDMVPEFATAAFAMKQGEYSKAPVKTSFGWHVIKVTGRRAAPPPSFEETRQQLMSEASREIVDAKIEDLRKSTKVETFGLDGGAMPAGGLTLAPDVK